MSTENLPAIQRNVNELEMPQANFGGANVDEVVEEVVEAPRVAPAMVMQQVGLDEMAVAVRKHNPTIRLNQQQLADVRASLSTRYGTMETQEDVVEALRDMAEDPEITNNLLGVLRNKPGAVMDDGVRMSDNPSTTFVDGITDKPRD